MKLKFIVTSLVVLSTPIAFAGNPSGIADVVGRDIDQVYLGHIGMWTGSNVLEVLSNPGIILENSLQSFKSQSTADGKGIKAYWGAKAANISAIEKQAVIAAGRNQKQFDPQYTTSFFYQEGSRGVSKTCLNYDRYGQCAQWKSSPYLMRAVFRCDTFVQYSYRKASAFSPSGLLPRNVYNNFPITR